MREKHKGYPYSFGDLIGEIRRTPASFSIIIHENTSLVPNGSSRDLSPVGFLNWTSYSRPSPSKLPIKIQRRTRIPRIPSDAPPWYRRRCSRQTALQISVLAALVELEDSDYGGDAAHFGTTFYRLLWKKHQDQMILSIENYSLWNSFLQTCCKSNKESSWDLSRSISDCKYS